MRAGEGAGHALHVTHVSWSPLECHSAVAPLLPLEELRALGRGGWEAAGCLGCVLPCAPCLPDVLGKKVPPRVPLCLLTLLVCSCICCKQLPKPCAAVLVQAFPLAAVLLEEDWDRGEAG